MCRTRPLTERDREHLKEYFFTLDGVLYARKSYCNRVKKGQEVGSNNGKGYLQVMCKGKFYMVHRVIYLLETGVWPEGVLDHKNGNTLDNRIENLRPMTQAQNTRSYGLAHKDSTSSYRGVHWFKRYKKWQAQIMYNGKRKHLGYFQEEREAARAWNQAAQQLGFSEEALNKL
jgi:hypothetical protein